MGAPLVSESVVAVGPENMVTVIGEGWEGDRLTKGCPESGEEEDFDPWPPPVRMLSTNDGADGLERQQKLSTATSTGMSISDAVRDMACACGIRLPRLERRPLRLPPNSGEFYSRICSFPIFVYFLVASTIQSCWDQGFGCLSCISYHYTLQ